MPLADNILRANFFDLKSSLNPQINIDLEPLKGFLINFFGSYHPLIYLNISVWHVTGNDKDYLRKIPRVVW
jgi:hypothetical protein